MSYTISYKDSPAPAFDAVEDIKNYLGNKYDNIAQEMCHVKSPIEFEFYCGLAGIHGYPVMAWYEHFHGQGTYHTTQDTYGVE